MTRQQLRQAIKDKRQQLTAVERSYLANNITKQIITSSLFLGHQHLAFYFHVNGEVDTRQLLATSLQMRKQCYLPVLSPLQQNRLWFARYAKNTPLITNRFNILQPDIKTTRCISPWALQIVFVPLVAFDLQGTRLGMGAGYYDRTFAYFKQQPLRHKPKLVGLAYELQKIEYIKREAWDIPLDYVITEKQIYNFK